MTDIRRALDDLVGTPPVNLGRRGAVMSRINRVHHRRKVAVQATLSVALLAGASIGATQVITATPAGSDKLYVEPTESISPEVVETPEATQAPDPKRPDKPKPTDTAGPADPADPAEPADPGNDPGDPAKPADPAEPADPKVPGDPADPKPEQPAKPADPKPTTKPSQPAADGLSVELWPYTAAAAGQSMDWKVKAYDGAGRLVRVEVHFGDGGKTVYEPDEACGSGVSLKKFFPHTYAKAGTYGASVTVTTGGCGAATETRSAAHSVTVSATAAGKPDNGPAVPTVSAERVAGEAVTLQLHGADSDGYVKKFWVDWGDGSPESYVGPRSLDACEADASTGRPGPSSWDPTASHGYGSPGTYTVKVVVMSTACDASDAQTATYTMTVTV